MGATNRPLTPSLQAEISPIALQSFLDNGHTSSQNTSAEVDQRAGVPTMKAIVIDDYGGVAQLHLRELPDHARR